MSHQSGIRVSQRLRDAFKLLTASKEYRLLKVEIVDSLLEDTGMFGATDSDSATTAESDQLNGIEFDRLIKLATEDGGRCCYLVLRLDPTVKTLILIAYVDDLAPVREKMLYASTRATLTKDLGDSYFSESIFASSPAELTRDHHQKHQSLKNSLAPMTVREMEMKQIKANEINAEIGASSRKQHAGKVNFPCSVELLEALVDFHTGKTSALLINVSETESQFRLVRDFQEFNGEISNGFIASLQLPNNCPSFILLRLRSAGKNSIVFLYICPDSSSIRQRMIYSSSKSALVDTIVARDIAIDKKLELSDSTEFTAEWILRESGLNENEHVDKPLVSSHGFIKKPLAPGGRRLMSNKNS